MSFAGGVPVSGSVEQTFRRQFQIDLVRNARIDDIDHAVEVPMRFRKSCHAVEWVSHRRIQDPTTATLVALRMAFSLPLCLFILWWQSRDSATIPLTKRDWITMLWLGFIGYYAASVAVQNEEDRDRRERIDEARLREVERLNPLRERLLNAGASSRK